MQVALLKSASSQIFYSDIVTVCANVDASSAIILDASQVHWAAIQSGCKHAGVARSQLAASIARKNIEKLSGKVQRLSCSSKRIPILILVAHTEKKSGHQKRFQWRIVTICHNNAPAEFNQTNFHKGFLLQSCQQIMFCNRTQPHRDKIYCTTHHEVQCLELEASWKVCALNILRRSRSKWWRSKPTELEQKLPTAKQHTISLMWVASETVCIGSPAAIWPAGEAPADKTSKSTPKKINSWLSRGVKLAFDYTCRSCVGLQNWR